MADELLTVREVAALAKLSEKTVRRAVASGELAAHRLRGQLRIRAIDLWAWVEAGRCRPVVRQLQVTVLPPAVHGSPEALRRIEAA